MAFFEFWGPTFELKLRFTRCGHVFKRIHIPFGIEDVYFCPECGERQPITDPQFAARDFVPTKRFTWGGAELLGSEPLSNPGKGRPMTTMHLLARMSAARVHRINLRGRAVGLPPELDDDISIMIVLRAPVKGCKVMRGSVAAPKHGAVVLEGSGAHFCDISFTGSGLVCAGAHHATSFHRCTFGCSVNIVHGATATFTECTFKAQFGVVASGTLSHASVSSCCFHACHTCIVAERGASVHVTDSPATKIKSAGVLCLHKSSRVCMEDCAVTCAKGSGSRARAGVSARDGEVCVRRSEFSWACNPLGAIGRTAKLEADTVSHEGALFGTACQHWAHATLRNVLMDLSHPVIVIPPGPPAVAAGTGEGKEGGRVQLERCRSFGATAGGFCLQNRAAVAALLCKVDANQEAVWVQLARVSLESCEVMCRDTCAKIQHRGSRLRLVNSELGSVGSACVLCDRAELVAVDSELVCATCMTENAALGVLEGSSARLLRCHLRTGRGGVSGNNGRAALRDCRITAIDQYKHWCSPSPGSFARTLGVAVTASDVRVDGGSVGPVGILGFSREAGGKLTVAGVSFEAFVQGLVTGSHGTLVVRKCNFCPGQAAEGVTAAMRGGQELGSYGLRLSGHREGTVEECEFTGLHVGVQCEGKEVAKLVNSKFSACGCAINVQKGANVSVQDCECTGGETAVFGKTGGFAIAATRLTVRGATHGLMATSDHGQSDASVKLVDCSFTGRPGAKDIGNYSIGVLLSGRRLHGSMLRCSVDSCTQGVCVTNAATARLKSVKMSEGSIGLQCGPREGEVGRACQVCRRQGAAAITAAWSALRAAPALVPAASRPRCMHEGARALVTMHDCEINGFVGGIEIGTHGHLTAARVSIDDWRDFSVWEYGLGERSEFEDCVVRNPVGKDTPPLCFMQGLANVVSDDIPSGIAGIEVLSSVLEG